ncbi:hypothetical protein HON22_03065 [Candidatus Peregrinibacteria bacterium]|jgi:hypothetical protein|nr:hypothetical protein [Candidatus Peregrinibacteria bacterium]
MPQFIQDIFIDTYGKSTILGKTQDFLKDLKTDNPTNRSDFELMEEYGKEMFSFLEIIKQDIVQKTKGINKEILLSDFNSAIEEIESAKVNNPIKFLLLSDMKTLKTEIKDKYEIRIFEDRNAANNQEISSENDLSIANS